MPEFVSQNSPRTPRNTIETILVLLLLLALILLMYNVLKVFFSVFTFALIFFVSFKNIFENLVKRIKNRRKLAAVIYSVILILVISLPFIYFFAALGKHQKEIEQWIIEIKTNGIPSIPPALANLPLIGESLSDFWHQLQMNPKEMITGHGEQLKNVLHHVLTGGISIFAVALQLALGIVISAFLLVGGDKVLVPLRLTLQHLLGKEDGLSLLDATGHAIRGVSIGVIGTAVIATIISFIGFFIAGIPFKVILAALVFFAVLIQVGPLVVWGPLIIWMATQGHTGMTVFIAAYTVVVLMVDSVLKPVLIAKSGGKLPFMVLFIGVIGGLAAWGFTGMFKGAIILAIFHKVFNSWLAKRNEQVLASEALS